MRECTGRRNSPPGNSLSRTPLSSGLGSDSRLRPLGSTNPTCTRHTLDATRFVEIATGKELWGERMPTAGKFGNRRRGRQRKTGTENKLVCGGTQSDVGRAAAVERRELRRPCSEHPVCRRACLSSSRSCLASQASPAICRPLPWTCSFPVCMPVCAGRRS